MELTPKTTVRALLLDACEKGDLKRVQTLLSYGGNINWQGYHIGWSPLHYAANNGSEALLNLALGVCGVEVNCSDQDKETPLMRACQLGHENIAALLCQAADIDVNLRDSSGRTALLHAVLENNAGCVEVLRATNGVDWNVKDDDGDSALSVAVDQGYAEILKIILSVPEPYLEVGFTDNTGRNIAQIAVEADGFVDEEEIAVDETESAERKDLKVPEEIKDTINEVIESVVSPELKEYGNMDDQEVPEDEWMEDWVEEAELVDPKGKEGVKENDDDEDEDEMSMEDDDEEDFIAEYFKCFLMLTEDPRVDWNIKNSTGETPLIYCLKNRKTEMARVLLHNPRVDRDTVDSEGNYAENVAR